MHRLVSVFALLVPSLALAGGPVEATDPGTPLALPSQLQEEAPASDDTSLSLVDNTSERNYDMEVSFRGRMLSVPGTILDIWYFSEKDAGWAPGADSPRPKLRGYGLGIEFVVKSKPREEGIGGANGIFYFDWTASLMDEGYWDDVEEPHAPFDGDYLVPSDTLGLLMLGANYAYEIHMVKTAKTNGNFGLSMLVGGGLGVLYMVGNLERWGPGENGDPGYLRYANGEPSDGDKRIPKVLPIVDINLGLRFNFGDRAVLRVEGGLHDLVFYGATLGIMF